MRLRSLGWSIPAVLSVAAGCYDAPKVSAQAGAPLTIPVTGNVAPYTWKSVRVGGGGFIPGIVFSRAERNLAYLRSDMGGAYRWDSALQTWIPLHDNFSESSYFGTESIAPDPVDPNTVYIAAGMYQNDPAAFLRSRDRGKTWQAFPVPFRMGGNNDGRGLGERLAVDPNDTRILYFGSRHDGLMKSTDYGETWSKIASFPLAGRGVPENGTNGGLSFVVFDPTTGTRGQATKTIFVGSADPGNQHMFRSDDAGATWKAITGEPKADFLPAKAEIDAQGVLYITYSNGIGPNGVTDGAVMKLNTRTGIWTDITPDKRPIGGPNGRGQGGYMGISLDRQNPGTLGVTTMNRWGPVDTVWRSTDGGATWADIVEESTRDTSEFPFLSFGVAQAKLGWWMSAFAIDPFNSDHATYATGATIYSTRNFSNVNKNAGTAWKPWVQGIEQTAVITLLSPPVGANLISGFGDIGGFVHDDFAVSPQLGMFTNPVFGNTNNLDYAGAAPSVVVRSGNPHSGEAALAYSEDAGRSWQPLVVPVTAPAPVAGRGGRNRGGNPHIIASADGKTMMVMTTIPQITRDKGKTWTAVQGLPAGGRPIADRVNGQKFYALDYSNGSLFTSTDGGATFSTTPTTGLPADISRDRTTNPEAAWTFQATSNREGDLWLVSRSGLFHSTDSGKTFARTAGNVTGGNIDVELLSFGKAPAGSTFPALFAVGRRGETRAIFRSDNAGASWIRINDAQHQWGNRFRCIAADPRVFGRVYIGTDGRGILYGEPVATRVASNR